jgi:inhibitor of cysteine peptidase
MKRAMQIEALALLAAVTVTASSGCGSASPEISLTPRDNGRQVDINRGQTLVVSLPGNPSTGYLWHLDEVDEQILIQTGGATFEPQSEQAGAPGLHTFHFQAVQAGETVLRFVYQRPWEKDTQPLETFSVRVSVR